MSVFICQSEYRVYLENVDTILYLFIIKYSTLKDLPLRLNYVDSINTEFCGMMLYKIF